MHSQEAINLLYNTAKQTSTFRTKTWIEIDDDAHGTYNTNTNTSNLKLQRQNQLYLITFTHIYL